MTSSGEQMEAARLALEQTANEGTTLASSIEDAHWPRRPSGEGWSPAECFVHLNLTMSAMLPLLETGAEEARAQHWTAVKPLRFSLLPRMLRRFLEPPYRIKTATLPAFLPGPIPSKAEVLQTWKEGHFALDQFIRVNSDLALDRPKVTSPFDAKGRVRYSVYAALLLLAAHERRHLWQAKTATASK